MGNSRQPFSARLVRNEPDIGRCSLTPRPLSTIRLRGCGSRHLDRPWPGASSRTVRLPVVKTELVVPPERVSARRRRHGSSARSPWSSTSPPLMRAPFVRGRARSRPTWRARSIGRAGIGERQFSSAAPWRRSRCCPGDCRSNCSEACARGRAAWCTAAGGAAAASRRCGSAFRRRHRLRRSHARRADRRGGWHSAAGCSCFVPLQQSYARAGP